MSSRHVTVAQVIERLKQFPPDMKVVMDTQCDPLEAYEGFFDGPDLSAWDVVPVTDMRSGMNPVANFHGEHHWDVLLLRIA